MKLEIDIPEHHYNNIMALDSVSLGRVPYKGIIMYTINAIKHGKALEQEPTTKENLAVANLADDIEGLTWYRVSNGQLTEGANSKTDTPLYKACDIEKILEKYRG